METFCLFFLVPFGLVRKIFNVPGKLSSLLPMNSIIKCYDDSLGFGQDRVSYIIVVSPFLSLFLSSSNYCILYIEMVRAGPVGRREISSEYNDWDEKGRTMISHIYVSFDAIMVRSIQFGYLENGAPVLSAKYGCSEGYNFRVVSFASVKFLFAF